MTRAQSARFPRNRVLSSDVRYKGREQGIGGAPAGDCAEATNDPGGTTRTVGKTKSMRNLRKHGDGPVPPLPWAAPNETG